MITSEMTSVSVNSLISVNNIKMAYGSKALSYTWNIL